MEHDIPTHDPQDHFDCFDDLADRTDAGVDQEYNSDVEESSSDIENDIFDHSEEEARNAVREARKSGRWCLKCKRAFETIEAYQQHLKTAKEHHLCQYCDGFKDYRSSKKLRLHFQKSHSSLYCEHCSMNFSSPADKQKHSESEHCVCERCAIWFGSQGRRRYHWATSEAHKDTYCKFCKLDFPDPGAYNTHFPATHGPKPQAGIGTDNVPEETKSKEKDRKENVKSGSSRKFYKDSNSKDGKKKPSHSKSGEDKSKKKNSGNSQEHGATRLEPKPPPNHYAMLKIPSTSSAEEIKKASRQRRIEVHPDRLKQKAGLSPSELETIDTEAKNVGFAAEVLGNETLRRRYDRVHRLWYSDG